jgi:hypothetical protein
MKIEYDIVGSMSLEGLAEEVNLRMEDGWIPQGSIVVIERLRWFQWYTWRDLWRWHWYQAITRQNKDEALD